MRVKPLFLLAVLLLSIFSVNTIAQSCYESTDQILSFTHPRDNSPYYFVFDTGWGNKVQDGTKITYTKGTSKLLFETGSVDSTQSELLQKTKIIFSKYNNSENYTKISDWASITVNGLPAFIIEFKDKQSIPNFGQTVVIYGAEVSGAKKYYAVTMTAKELNYQNEKTLFEKYYKTFNLELPGECTDDGTSDDTGDSDDTTDDTGDTTDDTGDTAEDTNDDAGTDDNTADDTTDNDGVVTDDSDDGSTSSEPKEPMKIFGFEPIIVAAAALVFLLIIFFVVIVIAVIGVVAYFMFFKKR